MGTATQLTDFSYLISEMSYRLRCYWPENNPISIYGLCDPITEAYRQRRRMN